MSGKDNEEEPNTGLSSFAKPIALAAPRALAATATSWPSDLPSDSDDELELLRTPQNKRNATTKPSSAKKK